MLAHALILASGQRQVATPRLQQAVRLLQLSSHEFAQEMTALAADNPFLHIDEGDATSDDDDDGVRDAWQQAFDSDRALKRDGAAMSAVDLEPLRPDLRAHLTEQVGLTRLSARDRALARVLIESLDDDGYLRTPLSELASMSTMAPEANVSALTAALRHVQALDPAGVGARDLSECLRLQLEGPQDGEPEEVSLAIEIVRHHLPSLARRDVEGMARALGSTLERTAAAARRIRRLDPRPGLRYSDGETRHLVPDVVARKLRGTWCVRLNPTVAPRLRLHPGYVEMFEKHRDATHHELASELKSARWAVQNVQQRLGTIAAVAEAIVRRQQSFLEFGALAMRPLGLQEIAEEVGVHESTVCRVTNNKFIATPTGVYELKHFFSRAMPTTNGSVCSAIAIRSLIARMIADENADKPLSDRDIAHQLHRQGVPVARRTVTKYRQVLKLAAAPARQRDASPSDTGT